MGSYVRLAIGLMLCSVEWILQILQPNQRITGIEKYSSVFPRRI